VLLKGELEQADREHFANSFVSRMCDRRVYAMIIIQMNGARSVAPGLV
jgi:hypothetical protein